MQQSYGNPNTDQEIKDFLAKFKTFPCYDNTCFIYGCIFYHTEMEKRRNPYLKHTFLYYPEYCPTNCNNQNCRKCHNQVEYEYHPLIFQTRKCPDPKCATIFCTGFHQSDYHRDRISFFFRFDLETFKTQPCKTHYQHDLKTCLFYHHYNDRRRPPKNYQHMECEKSRQGKCEKGDACNLSHNKIQQLYHPSRYKSKFCDKYPAKIKNCEYKDFCSFAHSTSEITIDLIHLYPQNRFFFVNIYKTIWCPQTADHERNLCVYAHNIQDFRRDPRVFKYEAVECAHWKLTENIKSIQLAGCKDQMNCTRCHGRKEYEYHPKIYNTKNEKYLEFPGFEQDQTIKKLRQEWKPDDEAWKPDPTGDHHLTKSMHTRMPSTKNTQIGAPFFQGQDNKSLTSSKITKAKSGETQSCTQSNREKVREKSVQSFSSQKKIPEFKSSYHQLFGSDLNEKQLFQVFQKSETQIPPVKPKRSFSESERGVDFRTLYSTEFNQLFSGTSLFEKIVYSRIPEVKLFNMKEEEISKLSWLLPAQRDMLIDKLRAFQDQQVSYSSQLYQHFKKFNKSHLLDQLKQKRVKQKKLLTMQQEEIQLLSFIQPQDRSTLPHIINDYLNNQEFSDINSMINIAIDLSNKYRTKEKRREKGRKMVDTQFFNDHYDDQ